MVNNQGKTDSPTGVEADLWAQELDKNKELNEKMEELCPIVITTIDCRPTAFKSADDKILSLKGAEGKLLELKDIGVKEVAKSSAEGRNEFFEDKKDGKPVEAMMALLGRRAMPNSNYGRAALGRSGLESKYNRKLIEPLDSDDPKGKLRNKNCKRWADQKGGIRHGYQTLPDALDYYEEQMKANYDKP